jgi:hypothetical protein
MSTTMGAVGKLEMSHTTRIMDGDPTAKAHAWWRGLASVTAPRDADMRSAPRSVACGQGCGHSSPRTTMAQVTTSRKGKKSINFHHQFWVREADEGNRV